jgi:putative tryptophan/tyrosine transport system substrate-binding protein
MRLPFLLSALVLSLGVQAQAPAKFPRVGVLQNGTVATSGHLTEAFVRGLTELGYADGKNIVLEVRYADGQLNRLPELARELGSMNLDVLFAPSALASNAARKAGVRSPIVFSFAPDPVAEGFVASLARPGGNMTGLTSLSPDMGAKRIEILREAAPMLSRVAVLHSLAFPGVPAQLAEAERGLKSLGKDFVPFDVKRLEDLEPAFAEMAKARIDAVLVIENPMFFVNRKMIVGLTQKHRLPSIYISKEYVVSGGLMSYGSSYEDLARRAATYVDRILKGVKAGDLPVEQPIKFELVVNLRAAKALGLALPQSLLLRADQLVD